MTAFVPVFAGDTLVFWTINRAHHSDIGGATYGAYNPTATSIFQEGLRIPPLKIYDQGVVRQDLLEMIATNTRHPATSRAIWRRRSARSGSASAGFWP